MQGGKLKMIKKILSKILEIVTPENINKTMNVFNKGVQDFGKCMDSMTREFSSDVHSSKEHKERESRKNQKNIEKLWGNSNKVKIWSDK